MSEFLTPDNIPKLVRVMDELSQKLRNIPSSDFFAINQNINVFLSAFGLVFLFIFGLCLMIFGFIFIAEAMIFLKAKRKSWAAIIPFYSNYVIFDIATGKGFLGVIYAFIWYLSWFFPICELICNCDIVLLKICAACISLILVIFMKFKLAKKFGHGIGFCLGLLLLPIIFYPILGFGESEYKSENEINKIKDKKDIV
ncbi:MAG: hypothetical protein IJU86_03240 [Firmicutes bacterium]|nr:hypothetical protein [Bacillota bacterium]